MASAASPLAIADVRYLWSEVDRLKSQVQQLQQSERHAHDEQVRLAAYVGSFVTQAQLEAALCTKVSQSNVASTLDRLRSEILDVLEKKADLDVLQSLQSKKLDISVYEASTWDLKRFRTALEQSVHDLFATFAHQIEDQVRSKISIDDFDRIFNPEANGQKAAIENAATKIARINDQLERLQEYVTDDRQRQHKLADLNVSLLDLTRKHNASRNSIAQLFTTLETAKERIHDLETNSKRLDARSDALHSEVGVFETNVLKTTTEQQQRVTEMQQTVGRLEAMNNQVTETLGHIQQFTQNTLLKAMEAKFKHVNDRLESELGELQTQHQQFRSQSTHQANKTQERVLQTIEQNTVLESRIKRIEAATSTLREELASVRGPLMSAAMNLREENVAILEEIRRSQDESREIILDYKGLLEKTAESAYAPAFPLRPASSSSVFQGASARRKQNQFAVMMKRIGDGKLPQTDRPHTSDARLHNETRESGSRIRASTAGSTPKGKFISGRSNQADSGSADAICPLPQRPRSEAGSRPRNKSILYTMPTEAHASIDRDVGGIQDQGDYISEAMFTFPDPVVAETRATSLCSFPESS
ncbi:hypothetical protein Poli38472_012902 [Pythium oligandrum]|uniref:Uncharacterized protein n=1 Tax=Pythium oligandrum TaxID=41045 RepID=A0A8K1CKE4_PYTOL|nr:hypothetical protein Poli38472_012902 [Pythium oligandrum]|eukprot:TMW64280.1 hypothetical protein Poli38472_012902 [Pythium oligandrum]